MKVLNYIFSAHRSLLFRVLTFSLILIAIPFTISLALQSQNLLGLAGTSGKIIFLEKPEILQPGVLIRVGLRAIEQNSSWVGLFAIGASDSEYLQRRSLRECLPSSEMSGKIRVCRFTMPTAPGLFEFRLYSQNNTRLADSQSVKVLGSQPSPTCTLMPPCLYREPFCAMKPPEPPGGWCPPPTSPTPYCIPIPIGCGTQPDGSTVVCDPPPGQKYCPTPTATPELCRPAFTHARNKLTGVCKLFPTSCLPDGWYADRSCQLSPTPGSVCIYEGRTYRSGERFPAADGCNSCSCDNGKVACTLIACPISPTPICTDKKPFGYACALAPQTCCLGRHWDSGVCGCVAL